MLSVQIYSDSTATRLLADLNGRIADATFSTNGHGFAALSVSLVPMSLVEAFEWYTWPGLPHVVASDNAAGVVWEGRLEDIAIVAGGVALVALGYQRAFYDAPYTGVLSKSSAADWKPFPDTVFNTSGRYKMDNNNRLYIAPKKGEVFSSGADVGDLFWIMPHRGQTVVATFAADYEMVLPAGWRFDVITFNDDYATGYVQESTITATGGTQTGSVSLTTSARAVVAVRIYNLSGADSTISADTGTYYLKLTNVRVKGTTSSAVTASLIALTMLNYIRATNSSQLAAGGALIEATTTDLRDEIYEDTLPADILDRLAMLHDCEWGVYEGQRLHFRPRGRGRQWYVDVAPGLELQRSLEPLRNAAYGVYRAADGGRTLRTPFVVAGTAARYGVARYGVVNVQTTSQAEAELHRDAFLRDRATLSTRAKVEFKRLYDAAGSIWPLYAMRAGDTVTMCNLPPTLVTEIDRIRTFRVAETEYDAAAGTLTIAPEEPLPTLDVLMARREAGLWR